MQRAIHELVFNRRFIKGKKTAGKVSSRWLMLDTIHLSECIWLKHAHHVQLLSDCNKEWHAAALFPGHFNGFLGDLSALTWCCPGNRSPASEWPCDGTSCRARCPGRSHWAAKQRGTLWSFTFQFSLFEIRALGRTKQGHHSFPHSAKQSAKSAEALRGCKTYRTRTSGTRQLHTCVLESFCHLSHYIHT